MQGSSRLLIEDTVNFCYCDESGTGDEPYAVMVGVLVDAGRMHLTKMDWVDLLGLLSVAAKRPLTELHTADFYSGSGVWRNLNGAQRTEIVSAVIDWLADRRHHLVYTAVDKAAFRLAQTEGRLPVGIKSLWQFMGFHLLLAIQRYSQPEPNNKGHTLVMFDEHEHDRLALPELVIEAPDWSAEYYNRKSKQAPLDQIIDVPVFANSKHVPLIQVADFLAFFLRRHAEIKDGLSDTKYLDEEAKIGQWIAGIKARSIGRQHTYPAKRNDAQEVFWRYAPEAIRSL
jgi:hypothetical protein